MFGVSFLGIWWRHSIWISEKLKFDYLNNEKSFWSETRNIFFVWQVLSFRLKKQTSKNIADTTFKAMPNWFSVLRKIQKMQKRDVIYFGSNLRCAGYFIYFKNWYTIQFDAFFPASFQIFFPHFFLASIPTKTNVTMFVDIIWVKAGCLLVFRKGPNWALTSQDLPAQS